MSTRREASHFLPRGDQTLPLDTSQPTGRDDAHHPGDRSVNAEEPSTQASGRSSRYVSVSALPRLLDVPAVCDRYGCEGRAARRIMREVGAFRASSRLFVRASDLLLWESTRLRKASPGQTPCSTWTSLPGGGPSTNDTLLAGWWREA